MKHLFIIISAMLVSLASIAQDYKVLERSEKKTPSWVGLSGEGYICVSASADDMDAARNQCMRNLKIEIIEGIATNVVSESKIYMQTKESNNVSEFVNEFMNSTSTKAATLPFITGISAAKATATYWEKKQDKQTRRITYFYAMQYPLSAEQLNAYREEFMRLDNEMVKLAESLEAGLPAVSSIADIDRGLAKSQECIDYFFDSQRKKWAEGIAARYNALPSRLSIHGKEGRDDSYTVWIELDGKKITPTGNPKLTSNCASDLKFSLKGQDYVITYDTSDCLSDEQNMIEVSFRIKGKNLREKFIIE